MNPRYNLARRKARDLLSMGGITAPPVPVDRLVSFVGAVVRYEPFEGDLSGMVHRRANGRSVIGVNKRDTLNRQRFTIAHEIGHLILHKDEHLHVDERYPLYRDARSSTAEHTTEIEANQFAAELLMPESMLALDMEKLVFDIESDDSMRILSVRYQVSQHAMTIRVSTLRHR